MKETEALCERALRKLVGLTEGLKLRVVIHRDVNVLCNGGDVLEGASPCWQSFQTYGLPLRLRYRFLPGHSP